MKKLVSTASLAALGVASLQAAYAPNLSPLETSKPWAISAALRGFYDDNYTTSPAPTRQDSFGVEFTPSVSLNLPMEQTFIGLSYTYSMRWYEAREENSADHMHQLTAKLDHAFSERAKLELSDSFVVAEEPEIIDPGVISVPLRTEGDNMRNTATINFLAQVSQLFGLEFGYQNTWYDYDQDGPGSRSAVLDRMQHLFNIDGRWQIRPETVGVVGYQFGATEYSSDESLFLVDPTPGFPGDEFGLGSPGDRDSHTHALYVGADHNFNSQLNASVRVGVQYTDFHEVGDDDIGPYADANMTYTYNPGSYLQAGIRHQRNQTDVAGFLPVGSTSVATGDLTLDQESTSVYASLNHKITPYLTGSLLGQYQRSEFQGGFSDGDTDDFFILGVNLAYRFNEHWLAETGYNYDKLNSDVGGRGYTRNRVYIGVRATY